MITASQVRRYAVYIYDPRWGDRVEFVEAYTAADAITQLHVKGVSERHINKIEPSPTADPPNEVPE